MLFRELGADTAQAFRALYDRERCQIAVDNALIDLGRRDRQLLNRFEVANQQLKYWHQQHHLAHACARNPATALYCVPKDQAWEAAILSFSVFQEASWKLLWVRNPVLASSCWKDMGVGDGAWTRNPRFPYSRRYCAVCGQVKAWVVEPSALPTWARACSHFAQIGGALGWRKSSHRWNYHFSH